MQQICSLLNMTICCVLKAAMQQIWYLKEDAKNKLLHNENVMKNDQMSYCNSHKQI